MRKVELLPTRDCEAGYGPEILATISESSASLDTCNMQFKYCSSLALSKVIKFAQQVRILTPYFSILEPNKSVRQYFLIGKSTISGSTFHNTLCYYRCSLAVVLHIKLFFFTFTIAMAKTICSCFTNLNCKGH